MSSLDDQPSGIQSPSFSQCCTAEKPVWNPMEGSDSGLSSGLSMKSDLSKEIPPDLTRERKRDSRHTPSLSASSVTVVQDLCDVCSDTAVKRCLTCMDSYCRTHVKDHYTSPDLQRHQLQDLQHQRLCDEHHRQLEFYCKTDKSAICSHCLLHNHMRHCVIVQDHHETQSKSFKKQGVPPPGPIQFSSVKPDSLTVSWSPPEGIPGSYRYRVTWRRGQEQSIITVAGLSLKVTDLIPGEKYHASVATLSEGGLQSSCVERSVNTELPPPEKFTVDVRALTACLKWSKPSGVNQASYLLEVFRNRKHIETIYTESLDYTITDLHGADYTISVCTVVSTGTQSRASKQTFKIAIPVPKCLTVSNISASSASLRWQVSPEMKQTPHSFLVSYQSKGNEQKSISTKTCSADITDLKPGTEYTVIVYTQPQHGGMSKPASVQMNTVIPVPECLTVRSISSTSAHLSWQVSPELKQTLYSFLVSYQSNKTPQFPPKSISTQTCSAAITGLKPGTEYTVTVYTQLQHGGQSQPTVVLMKTEMTASTVAVAIFIVIVAIMVWASIAKTR